MMGMVEVKTADLAGPALDYAVAQATEAWKWAHKWFPTMTLDPTFKGVGAIKFSGGSTCMLIPNNSFRQDHVIFKPSTDWSQGGPLIEEYQVEILRAGDNVLAKLYGLTNAAGEGRTPLIAACRAIVFSKLGAVVSLPAELVACPA